MPCGQPSNKQEVFLEEVLDQPRALKAALQFYRQGEGADLLSAAALICRKAPRGPVMTGMGSSNYASLISAHLLNEQGLPCTVYEAGELLYYYLGGLHKEQVLVAVSQSGQTTEVRKIVSAVAGRMPVIGVTNNPDSWLGKNSQVVLPMMAGPETMSSSKTYVNTMAVLAMLAWKIAGRLDDQRFEELSAVPGLIQRQLDGWEQRMAPALAFLDTPLFLHFIGRGPALANAMQAQVIIKEGAHILTEAHSGASFRHGPFEIINEDHRAVVFAPRGLTGDVTLTLVRDMAAAGSKVLYITNDAPPQNERVIPLILPDVAEYIFPMISIVPVELLLILFARQQGVVPGALTLGNKVTVRE